MKIVKDILRKNKFTAGMLEVYFFSQKFLKPKGWMLSRFKHQPMNSKGEPIPWFTYSAIHFISQKIEGKSLKVFEFGSGNSTIWFAPRVKSIMSVEHHPEFYATTKAKLDVLENVTYEFRNLKDNYHQKLLEFENEFDIIIIDGRERVQCARNSIKALKKEGVIIWDNSDRMEYAEGYDYLTQNGFKKIDFRGMGPISHSEWQTSVFYRNDNCFDI